MVKKNTFAALAGFREMAVAAGSVFLGPWENIDHEKFIVVAGVDEDKILVCSVMINSRISQYIQKRPHMFACQVEVKAEDYDFLSHDSYVNCAQPIKASFDYFKDDVQKYCGLLSSEDLEFVREAIINSGTLSNDEIKQFFGEKTKS